jgi:hypothetical protein
MDSVPIRWIFLPYCIKRLTDGRYIILNRRYKPLGTLTNDYVIYETHPSAAHIDITKSIAKKLAHDNSDDINDIYLYSDGCIPTNSDKHLRAYSERLAVLMQLGVEVG